MKALVVKVRVKREHHQAFVEEMLLDARGSERTEPGCIAFHVVQDDADPDVLHLFEVYRDDAAIAAHQAAPHFQRWVEATKHWHEHPPEVRTCSVLHLGGARPDGRS